MISTTARMAGLRKVSGLSEFEQKALDKLMDVWGQKYDRNAIREKYYNGTNKLKDLNISIPPSLRSVETVCGWPAKAVDALAARSRFDGFTFFSDMETPLESVILSNDFKSIYIQLLKSVLIHSCAFVTVTAGGDGEPAALISSYSALQASAVWDMRKRRVAYGMCIVDVDEKTGEPSQINLHMAYAIFQLTADKRRRWYAEMIPHSHGRPLMEALTYRPSLDRPLGRSRISRAVMSLTDSAVREALRAEVSAEFFTAPQRYLLGATEEDFDRDRWATYIGSIFVAGRDEEGEIPHYGQLPQGTMQPHIDYMRSLAAQFAGETSIPVSYLGIIHDNPASAEAMYAASEELIIEASDLNASVSSALRNIGLLTLAIAQRKTIYDLTADELTLMPKFMNPGRPSIVSQSDAMIKQASAAPWIAETQVFLEELGYNEEQIARMEHEKRRAETQQALASLMGEGSDTA